MPTLAGVTAALAVTGAVVRDDAPPAAAGGVTLVVHVRGDGTADRMLVAGVDDSGRAVLLSGPARLPAGVGAAPGARPTGPALARTLEAELGLRIDRVMVVDDYLLGRILDPERVDGSTPRTDPAALEAWVRRLADRGVAAAVRAVDGRLDPFVTAAGSGRARIGALPQTARAPGEARDSAGGPGAAADEPGLDVGRARAVIERFLPSAVRGAGPADG